MNVVGMLLIGLSGVAFFAGFVLGIVNYARIFREARNAGRGFWELYWFGAYQYAFNEKRGSRETRRMVIGFLTMGASAIAMMLVAFLIDASRH